MLARIEKVNPSLNAYCTVAAEQALAAARRATAALGKRGAVLGPLHGVPVSIKDLTPTKGIRTTWGSKIYEHHVPEADALVVERLKAAGAIVIGKTNTPEFGAGANTFNEVFGVTRNPWNPKLTCGGSTGGGAVALATGLGPLAQGSDLGGSLRLPAAFCGVVGFRTSPGCVPVWPGDDLWDTLSVQGPMARTVADTALMLSTLVGPDPRVPISYPVDAARHPGRGAPAQRQGAAHRVGRRSRYHAAGPRGPARDRGRARRLPRARRPGGGGAPGLRRGRRDRAHRPAGCRWSCATRTKLAQWKPHDAGEPGAQHRAGPDADPVGDRPAASGCAPMLFERVRGFMERYDLIVTPTAAVPPFPVEMRSGPTQINGVEMTHYIQWALLTYAFTVINAPAISVPCGFTRDGLPVGLQIAGRWHDEVGVLRAAAAFEEAAPWAHHRPAV